MAGTAVADGVEEKPDFGRWRRGYAELVRGVKAVQLIGVTRLETYDVYKGGDPSLPSQAWDFCFPAVTLGARGAWDEGMKHPSRIGR